MGDTQSFDFINFHTILNHPAFVRTRGTLMFHYNTGQTLTTTQVFDVIQSYFNRGEFNLVVITYADSSIINTDVRKILRSSIYKN